MPQRVGFIQTRGIGDIIIALPIADAFIEQGCEVVWPIDAGFVSFLREAKPEVKFVEVPRGADAAYLYNTPLALLQQWKCDQVFCLYNYLGGEDKLYNNLYNEAFHKSLKFDEYKYAVTGIPFSRKWDLRIYRNLNREIELHRKLQLVKPYICVHRMGSNLQIDVTLPQDWIDNYQIVEVSAISDNPFDWIYTFERAEKLVMIDSCFANLVEQLNIQVEKYFLLQWNAQFTPVLKNGRHFLGAAANNSPQATPEKASPGAS